MRILEAQEVAVVGGGDNYVAYPFTYVYAAGNTTPFPWSMGFPGSPFSNYGGGTWGKNPLSNE